MKKLVFLLLCSFLVFGCIQEQAGMTWGKSNFYEVKIAGTGGGEDISYYFEYPSFAQVEMTHGLGEIDLMGQTACPKLDFGDFDLQKEVLSGLVSMDDVEIDVRKEGGSVFERWIVGDKLFFYAGYMSDSRYGFWALGSTEEDQGACVEYVEKVLNSFTDKPSYFNDKYSFKVSIPADYKAEDLPEDTGVLLKKWVETEVENDERKMEPFGYKVELMASVQEDIVGYRDVLDFVGEKYAGYTAEFVNLDEETGVYIGEGLGDEAMTHFFLMEDGVIYDVSLKVLSQYYSLYEEEYKAMAQSIEVF